MTHWDDGDFEDVPPTVPTTPQPVETEPDDPEDDGSTQGEEEPAP
jgi:hypothetical protein